MDTLKKDQTILVVDDSPVNIQMLGQLLKNEWTVKVATNGKTALSIANSEDPPDLILLDVMMPEIDGYKICEILKASEATKDIPVIFVTAMSQQEDEAKGLELGAIDYITKPYHASIVKARVRNHLELKQYRDLLKDASLIDGLTGIPNRRRFDEVLSTEWKRSFRDGKPISVLMADIDYFKRYNDHYGHLEGDECLRKVADCLRRTLKRPGDLVARYGGEEFVGIMPMTGEDGAFTIAESFRKAVEAMEIEHVDSPISEVVTISVGVSTMIPSDKVEAEKLVEKADNALYEAKKTGRNQVKKMKDDQEPSNGQEQ
ncbi:diguanylate cyclase (GGDEF) domain-containing protein [Tindallia magadiensis]|uniref:Stage 0 sporulation protein A homolog n=1 Tax=Tindallia magadiensis TaxID=69895 RepID=A0A1I3FCQ6_9FIRM|nr:PleD family two-component system response regulator [Tindallia magadiensis]SFI08995.1 diguanylate cyclase (GGDEF) domain-containing protein [Tindallia magadiensis]